MKTKVLLLVNCLFLSLNLIGQTITGPNVVGGSEIGIFKITGLTDQYVVWECSNDLQIVSSNPIQVQVKVVNTAVASDGFITGIIKDYNDREVKRVTRFVGVNGPHVRDIEVTVKSSSGEIVYHQREVDGKIYGISKGICPNSFYYVTYKSPTPITNVRWELSFMTDGEIHLGTDSQLEFRTGRNTRGGIVKATGTTIYGTTKKILDFTLIEDYSCTAPYYSAYSVLGSNTLKIKFDMDSYLAGEQQSRNQTSFDIKLYNITGNLVKTAVSRGEDLDIDVSNISNGYYVLHIYDGKSNQPYVQNISIQK